MPPRRRSPLRHAPTTAARGDPPTIRVELLGGFELGVDGRSIRIPVHAQRLVAFLALHDRPLHRAYVAGRLWIDLSQEQAHNCLRSTLWRMRGPSRPVVDASATHLVLDPAVDVDARELESAASRVLHHESLSAHEIDQLVNAADLLVDWYEDWVVEERDRLRHLRLLALETACTELVAANRFTEALVAGYPGRRRRSAQGERHESADRSARRHGQRGGGAAAIRGVPLEPRRDTRADPLSAHDGADPLDRPRARLVAQT